MRLNSSQCSSVKETLAIRKLRSTKVSSGVERQKTVFSDISNSRCIGREKNFDHSIRTGRAARKSSSSLKQPENEKCVKPDALTKPRRINAVCQSLSCTTIGRKRVVGVDGDCGAILQGAETTQRLTRSNRSSEVYLSSPEFETSPLKRSSPPSTPSGDKPSRLVVIADEAVENGGDSLLEGLPFDLLVRIVCSLQHDELKPVFQVCGRLRNAATIARQFHFNFTTPGRAKNERLGPLNFRPAENLQCGHEVALERLVCPPTPNAPRQLPYSSQPRISDDDLQPFAPPLFQESVVVFPNSGNFFRKSRTVGRDLPSHRVLFYEDELCQAVAENTI